MLYRQLGVEHLRNGHYAAAAKAFKTAARYADKLWQTTYAELLWEGLGVEQDRPLAYAWMDLAAERGNVMLLVKRERYWDALSPQERAKALEVGQAVYAGYGDAVAKPRQERHMARARKSGTGSRLRTRGHSLRILLIEDLTMGNEINLAHVAGGIDGGKYYSGHYWEPEAHWALQERMLNDALQRQGKVHAGDIYRKQSDSPEANQKPQRP